MKQDEGRSSGWRKSASQEVGEKEIPVVFRKRGNGDPGAVAQDLNHGRESGVK